MIKKIDKYNWAFAAFPLIMKACSNPKFIQFVQENEDKEESAEFYLAISDPDTFEDLVYYIKRIKGEWHFWKPYKGIEDASPGRLIFLD